MIRRLLVACAACAIACSSPKPITSITVSTGDLIPAFSPTILEYEVTSLTTMVPVSITVAGTDVTIGGEAIADSTPFSITVSSLDDATSILVNGFDALGKPVTYTIHTVPKVRPQYTVTTLSSPTPGQILVAPTQLLSPTAKTPFLYILDETGRLQFYKKMSNLAFDFQRQTLSNGTQRYTYIALDAPVDLAAWPVESCTAYVLDDHFNQLRTVRLDQGGTHPSSGVDAHDFRLIDDDHWIALSYIGETVTNVPGFATANVVSAVVQEVNGDSVVFDWETTSVPELYADSTEGNDFSKTATPLDYSHLNSVEIDPANGNPVVSLRHDDAIVELDRTSGQIVWTLSGLGDDFGLAAADKTSHQHHARFLEPNHLLVFDNGNASSQTKIREYQIDPQAHTAQVLAALSVDAHFSTAMGSVQKLGGRYFVGWGYHLTSAADVTEIDPATMTKSFEMSFQDGYASYRALKY